MLPTPPAANIEESPRFQYTSTTGSASEPAAPPRQFSQNAPMPLTARALLACVFLSLGAVAHGANVTGTVRAASSHAPLQSMVVAAYDASGNLRGTATTDATGLYVLSIPAGSYRFLAYDPAGVYATVFDDNASSFETTPLRGIGSSGASVDFMLMKGGYVTGTVRPGAVVEAYNLSGTRRGFTTASTGGDFTLVLPPGDYKLVAFDPNGAYAASFWQNARAFAEAAAVRVREGQTTANVDFTLVPAARVSGTAVDAATLAPLPSMLVYAYTPAGSLVATVTTNATGAFALSLPPGTYRFVAADPAHVFATAFYDGSRSFEKSNILTVVSGEQRPGVVLRLERAFTISGHVTAAGLTVAAYNLDGTLHTSTTSNSAGNYTLAVAPGTYKIGVSDPQLVYATQFWGGSSFRTATPVNGAPNVTGIDITPPRAGRVNGLVRANGLPVAGIQVAAYDSAGMLASVDTSDEAGRYALALAPGSYRLLAFDTSLTYATAYAGGATSFEATVPLIVHADGDAIVDFSLQTGLRVTGQVASRGGVALTGIEVFALDAAGNRVAAATSNEGTFTIVLRPGTYRFMAVDPEGRYNPAESASVTVSEGQLPSVVLTLETVGSRRRSVRH